MKRKAEAFIKCLAKCYDLDSLRRWNDRATCRSPDRKIRDLSPAVLRQDLTSGTLKAIANIIYKKIKWNFIVKEGRAAGVSDPRRKDKLSLCSRWSFGRRCRRRRGSTMMARLSCFLAIDAAVFGTRVILRSLLVLFELFSRFDRDSRSSRMLDSPSLRVSLSDTLWSIHLPWEGIQVRYFVAQESPIIAPYLSINLPYREKDF